MANLPPMEPNWPRRIFFLLLVALIIIAVAVAAHNVVKIHEKNSTDYRHCILINDPSSC